MPAGGRVEIRGKGGQAVIEDESTDAEMQLTWEL
jgi:hypothetical protein